MDKDEFKQIKDQILEEIWKGKGETTARILRRNKGITIEQANEVAAQIPLLEWRREIGPKGGRPSYVFSIRSSF